MERFKDHLLITNSTGLDTGKNVLKIYVRSVTLHMDVNRPDSERNREEKPRNVMLSRDVQNFVKKC